MPRRAESAGSDPDPDRNRNRDFPQQSLLTNVYSTSQIAAYVAQAQKSADMMAALQGAQVAYLQAAYDQVATSYGNPPVFHGVQK